MKGRIRFIVSAYIVIISLIIFNLFTSTDGILSYVELSEYKAALEQNISELGSINNSLVKDSDKLIKQPDEIKIQARELGWVEPREGIIVVKGWRYDKSGYSMGRLLSRERTGNIENYSNLIISVLIGLSFYILTGFFRKQEI
ncbi:MAG: septum formation initiator family protein [Spirochaetales bacterium]|uniref:Septum formation initiator family protein n=1 Tax=Candidatus Thalassospirochaeta sargassi TaxID=3119039 RepID=A0AAJ1ML70_9SPIO|nr:septum formation initiator family protein [Spirochaetales bacterium]